MNGITLSRGRRIPLVAVSIVCLLTIVVLVWAPAAFAYSGSPPQTSGSWSDVWTALGNDDPATIPETSPSLDMSTDATSLMSRARRAALLLPRLSALNLVYVQASEFTLGWAVGNYVKEHWIDGFFNPEPSLNGSYQWRYRTGSPAFCSYADSWQPNPPCLENVWLFETGGNVDEFSDDATVRNQTDYANALTMADEPDAVLVKVPLAYCGTSGSHTCYAVVRTEDEMERRFTVTEFSDYVWQQESLIRNYEPITLGFTSAGDPGSSSETATDVREILAEGDTGTDFQIGRIIDEDWDGLDDETLLQLYAPRLQYDSQESFYADSAATITDNVENDHVNYLNDYDDTTLASSDESVGDQLSLDYLAPMYEGTTAATSDDALIEDDDDRVADATDLHAQTEYNDHVYGRVERDGYVIYLQYWFFYYYNDYPLGDHEGDWEGITLLFNPNQTPVATAYNQHVNREGCDWDVVPKTPDGRPMVYVALGSHASYYRSGDGDDLQSEFAPGLFFEDSNDGQGGAIDPTVEDISGSPPDWMTWPGKWGRDEESMLHGTVDSPHSPYIQDNAWDGDDITTWFDEAADCTISVE